jgi:hypothetical protein
MLLHMTDTKYGVEDRRSVLTLTLQKRQFKIRKVGVRVRVELGATLILYVPSHFAPDRWPQPSLR